MSKFLLSALLLSFLWPTASAQAKFSADFNLEGILLPTYVDQISQEYFEDISIPAQQRLEQYKVLADQLSVQHDHHQSIWYFIQGLNSLNIISLLKQIETESGIQNQDEIDQYNTLLQSAFKNALDHDNSESELSANMYAIMQRALDGDARIDALKHELSLGGSGDSEASYWFKHWQVIGALQQAGRLQEAEQASQQMKLEISQAGLENSIYAQLQARVEQEVSQSQIKSSVKLPSASRIDIKKTSKFEKFLGEYWPMILINLIMFGFILITALFAFKKKR